MQLTYAICYILLTIIVTASCLQEETQKQQLSETKLERRINKREAALFIENFPSIINTKQKAKIIYRKMSKPSYRKAKPKYGSHRAKYGPTYPPKERNKKYTSSMNKYQEKHVRSKYGPPIHTYDSKPTYGPFKNYRGKTFYGTPNQHHYKTHYPPEPTGFGEPPTEDMQTFKPPRPINNDVLVDSYGAPLKSSITDPTVESSDSTKYFHNKKNNMRQEPNNWQDLQKETAVDNSYAYSKKRPTYINSDSNGDVKLNSYSNVYKYETKINNRNKKPHYSVFIVKDIEQQRKKPENSLDSNDHVLVGGQYAEPPARFVSKIQPSDFTYFKNEDFFSPQRFVDSDVAASATMSSYVNYKHSNMAFSPQNLNDAFSIVDK